MNAAAQRLSTTDRAELDEHPWLEPIIEDGDTSLEPARERYGKAMAEARAELQCCRRNPLQADAHRPRSRNHRAANSFGERYTVTRHLVRVDPDGAVFRGLAVPFGESALLVEKDDRLVAEQFDRDSIRSLPQNIPLLIGHRRDQPPAGIVTSSGVSHFGLGIEGRLIGSDAEIDGWRRKLAAGLMAGLSVGFIADERQEWRRPERYGAPPVVVRRGVEVVEISLVQWGAYDTAGIVSLNARTAASDECQRIIAEIRAELRRTAEFLARKR